MTKQRHGCLTAWLIFGMIMNSITALTYLFGADMMVGLYPSAPSWAFPVLTVMGILNVVFSVALWQWKKWGVWGFVITTILSIFVNLAVGLNIGQSLLGLIGIAILFGVLQIGKENKGWPQLE